MSETRGKEGHRIHSSRIIRTVLVHEYLCRNSYLYACMQVLLVANTSSVRGAILKIRLSISIGERARRLSRSGSSSRCRLQCFTVDPL